MAARRLAAAGFFAALRLAAALRAAGLRVADVAAAGVAVAGGVVAELAAAGRISSDATREASVSTSRRRRLTSSRTFMSSSVVRTLPAACGDLVDDLARTLTRGLSALG